MCWFVYVLVCVLCVLVCLCWCNVCVGELFMCGVYVCVKYTVGNICVAQFVYRVPIVHSQFD